MNYEQFFINRIAELRKQKGVSARDMSLSVGQNVNYVNHIERGKMFPSMTGFFALCDYLGVTPRDFFDADTEQPAKLNALTESLKKLDEDALAGITSVVEKMLSK
jgi:transcriptional regulator with XRE-family HTH domain